MQVQPEIVQAILLFFGIPLVGLIQTVKRWLKVEGWGAIALAVVISYIATAIYLAINEMFTVVALLVYGFIVAGEASGLYHVFKKTT